MDPERSTGGLACRSLPLAKFSGRWDRSVVQINFVHQNKFAHQFYIIEIT